MATELLQGLKVKEGVWRDFQVSEEVMAAPIDPVSRYEGAGKETLCVSNELVDYFVEDLSGKLRWNHFGVGDNVESNGQLDRRH